MDKSIKKPKYEVPDGEYIGERQELLLCYIANELAELNENLKHFQKHGVGVLNLP
jgi:hypothetical protein